MKGTEQKKRKRAEGFEESDRNPEQIKKDRTEKKQEKSQTLYDAFKAKDPEYEDAPSKEIQGAFSLLFKGKKPTQEDRYCLDKISGKFTKEIARKNFLGAIEKTQKQIESDPSLNYQGSTLTAALLYGKELTVANIGDSRTYIVRKKAEEFELILLTKDHDLNDPKERERVLKGGAFIAKARNQLGPERVNGIILVTRGMGDVSSLQQYKGAHEPDIFDYEIEKDDELLLQLTDGATISAGRIAKIIEECQKDQEKYPANVLSAIAKDALKAGSADNIGGNVYLFNHLKWEKDLKKPPKEIEEALFFGVFDGHGGSKVAQLLKENLTKNMKQEISAEKEFAEEEEVTQEFTREELAHHLSKIPSGSAQKISHSTLADKEIDDLQRK